MSLPIDLRLQVQPARDQGETRPTCLAFAATAAHEHARELSNHLCVEILYFNASKVTTLTSQLYGLTLDSVCAALSEYGQPEESVWPYKPNGPIPECPPSFLGQVYSCVLEIQYTPDSLITSIRSGVPVVVALEITQEWYSDLAPDYVIRELGTSSVQKSSVSHAVLAIGIREDERGEILILIQNSWGIRWADNGCAWLSLDYVYRHFLGSLVARDLL